MAPYGMIRFSNVSLLFIQLRVDRSNCQIELENSESGQSGNKEGGTYVVVVLEIVFYQCVRTAI